MFLTEAGAAVHVQARARVAFAVVGAPGVNASVLAASIMDLALINICRERRERRDRQKQRDGREMSAIWLNPLIMEEKKIGHKNKAQMSCQAEEGI